jgi:L-fuconolactonase
MGTTTGGRPMVRRATNHDWLEQVREQALDPDLPICDPHHHLWDFREGGTQARYFLDEMLEDLAGGHNIVSSVFIECGTMYRAEGPPEMACVGETEFVNGIAAMAASGKYGPTRVAAGIVGSAELTIGDPVADVLDAHIAAGNGRFRGLRLGASWHESPAIRNHRTEPGPGLFTRAGFREGFKHLAPRGISFEGWCYHTQLGELTELARDFPDTVIILDHLGGPLGLGPYAGKQDEVFEAWKPMMVALAECDNVVAKIGGINMDVNGYGWHERPTPPTSQELCEATRRWYEHMIETFGTKRCMFESNFPVDKLSCSYTVLWNSFKRLAEGWSDSEKADLFHDTAARVYRL